jgi:hypothetical protein
MSDKWDFYLTRVKENVASLFVDMGIFSDAPKVGYPVRLTVLVKQKHPRHDGLTTNDEAKLLWKLEDALVPAVSDWGGIFVGRVTTEGRRDFIFYGTSAGGFDAAVSQALAPCDYEYDTHHELDAEWKFYREFLYPRPWEWQMIMNRHVLENLKKGGDDLSKPRRIFHWLYFSAEADRHRCAEAARAKGFGLIIIPPPAKPGQVRPLGLELHRIDSVAPKAIDAVCFELFTLAKENSGAYDGWETQVVKAGSEPIDDAPAS